MTRNHLKIEQGGFVFDIRVENRRAGVISEVKKHWRLFLTNTAPVDVEVGISCYDARKVFTWPPETKAPFIRMFRKIRDRYPFEYGNSDAPDPPEDLLKHLNPLNDTIKHIGNRLSEESGIMFANADSGLFFFDPGEMQLYVFTRHTRSSSAFFSWFALKSYRSTAVLMADITNGIMLAVSWLLVNEGGLLLHGTGLGKSDQAVILLGMSGAGKSTVARKCTADTCFSDDGVIIKKTAGGFYLHPSVFMQFRGHWRGSPPNPIALRKIFLLKKSGQDCVTSFDKNRLMHHILLHLIHFFRYFDKRTANKAFENTLDIVDALPAFRFNFTRNREEWSDVWRTPKKRRNTNPRS